MPARLPGVEQGSDSVVLESSEAEGDYPALGVGVSSVSNYRVFQLSRRTPSAWPDPCTASADPTPRSNTKRPASGAAPGHRSDARSITDAGHTTGSRIRTRTHIYSARTDTEHPPVGRTGAPPREVTPRRRFVERARNTPESQSTATGAQRGSPAGTRAQRAPLTPAEGVPPAPAAANRQPRSSTSSLVVRSSVTPTITTSDTQAIIKRVRQQVLVRVVPRRLG